MRNPATISNDKEIITEKKMKSYLDIAESLEAFIFIPPF